MNSATHELHDTHGLHYHSVISPNGNSSSAIQVGIGIGVPLGVLAIAATLYALWERSRRRKMAVPGLVAPHQGKHYGLAQDKPPAHTYQELTTPPTELEGRAPRHEIAYQYR